MKIVTIIGTRPQYIKCAPVSKELKKNNITEILIDTGQHYDDNMSKIFFKELHLPIPNYNLNIHGGSHGQQTGMMIMKLEPIIQKENPDCVIVYGDTNSTLAGAIAASKLNTKLIHIEAGLRSFDMSMPEEINRLITDSISNLLFCPTKQVYNYMKSYTNPSGKVYFSGDVMYDALLQNIHNANAKSNLINNDLFKEKYILATIHRHSNTDESKNMKDILMALKISKQRIILPLHPRTKKYIRESSLQIPSNIITINPLSYLDMLYAISHSNKIITDSGGVQKEAYMLKKQCVTLRKTTEWKETIMGDWNRLVGTDINSILKAISEPYPRTPYKDNIFGDGKASQKIVKIINDNYG